MALGDTAKLVASLELQDKFSRNADRFNAAVGGMEQRVGTLGRIGSDVGRGLGNASANLQRLAVVGVGVIGANVAAGIQTLIRLEEVTAATNAVIKSTGGVAGISAEEVRNLAEKFEGLNATMDDKVIQSGENMLLTFTNITEKAFEPALQAALDMNQAMGGGEEGLQTTIIQIGKALQDPIRGATALRRVGVNLSKQQKEQIKILVEQNDLYGAQRIILDELATEFGGQFAAAGDTAAGKFAKFRDAIEDAQAALATAFLPVLGKVADKLTTFLSDPATIAAIERFGGDLAEGFEELVKIAGDLPWESIGDAFSIMGTGAKALLDAFLGLPPWVQTAVLTGWGLNKLTGGALASIAGTLASGLIRGILGINAGVVNITAGTVTGAPTVPGGGVGTAATGGIAGALAIALRTAGVVAIFTAIGVGIGELIAQNVTRPANQERFDFLAAAAASGNFPGGSQLGIPAAEQFAEDLAAELGLRVIDVEQGIVNGINQSGLTFDQAVEQLRVNAEKMDTLADIEREGNVARSADQGALLAKNDLAQTQAREGFGSLELGLQTIVDREVEGNRLRTEAQQTAQQELNLARIADAKRASEQVSLLREQASANVKLQQISAKDFAPDVNVSTSQTVNIDGRTVTATVTKTVVDTFTRLREG